MGLMKETVEVEQFMWWSIGQYLPERATISVTERPWDINLEIMKISPSSAVGRFVSVMAFLSLFYLMEHPNMVHQPATNIHIIYTLTIVFLHHQIKLTYNNR